MHADHAHDPRLKCGAYVKRGYGVRAGTYRNLGQPPELDGLFQLEGIVGKLSQIGGSPHYIFPTFPVDAQTILDRFDLVRAAPETEEDLDRIDAAAEDALKWYRAHKAVREGECDVAA